jgi:hypothetical protein
MKKIPTSKQEPTLERPNLGLQAGTGYFAESKMGACWVVSQFDGNLNLLLVAALTLYFRRASPLLALRNCPETVLFEAGLSTFGQVNF